MLLRVLCEVQKLSHYRLKHSPEPESLAAITTQRPRHLADGGWSTDKITSQCYDGASVMSRSGVQVQILLQKRLANMFFTIPQHSAAPGNGASYASWAMGKTFLNSQVCFTLSSLSLHLLLYTTMHPLWKEYFVIVLSLSGFTPIWVNCTSITGWRDPGFKTWPESGLLNYI